MERAFRNNAKYYQSISQKFTDNQYGIRQWSISNNLTIQHYPSRSFKLINKNKIRTVETIKIEQNLFSTKKSKRRRKTSSKAIIPYSSNENIIYRTENTNCGYEYENNVTVSFNETTSNCTNYGVADITNNTLIVSSKHVNYSQSESDDSDHHHQDYRLSKNKTHGSFDHSKNLLKISPTSNLGRNPRPIIIDGLNIGHTHGYDSGKFSAKGVDLCVKYFADRGHIDIVAFIPQHRRGSPGTESKTILNNLVRKGHICYTPSRQIQNIRMTSYDGRIMFKYAYQCGGVVVSNDNFRNLYKECEEFREIIEKRQVMITFVRDCIIVPDDQYNRKHNSRSLSEMLYF